MMNENKQLICDKLLEALQLTRQMEDLTALTFDPETEIVTAKFKGGNKKINVACDSGYSMISDLIVNLNI